MAVGTKMMRSHSQIYPATGKHDTHMAQPHPGRAIYATPENDSLKLVGRSEFRELLTRSVPLGRHSDFAGQTQRLAEIASKIDPLDTMFLDRIVNAIYSAETERDTKIHFNVIWVGSERFRIAKNMLRELERVFESALEKARNGQVLVIVTGNAKPSFQFSYPGKSLSADSLASLNLEMEASGYSLLPGPPAHQALSSSVSLKIQPISEE